MNPNIVLVSTFVAVLLIVFTVVNYVLRRREVAQNIDNTRRKRTVTDAEIDRILGSENEDMKYYLDVVQNESPNSLRMRLVQAGYFSRSAIWKFNLIRLCAAAVTFMAVQFGASATLESLSTIVILSAAMILSAIVFVFSSAVLENIGKRRTREFKKLFPDFMDLLMVCVDAGLGIEAALDRVTREFLATTRDFGLQLSIINLEVRAGRPLHEALQNFSRRINLEEARTLAVLFKQSQELGASISKTLRVFAKEMRTMRLLRAEEKANALPVKMLFPMALFMFPVNLIIVLVPILMIILKTLSGLTPPQ
ncbi:type II secretion system F family protein [Aestuariicoccus sp. MJ-SS9]|uniref:type II secretion system F family protein n=1 Tax=Aestuariicoccus sp. MJ-SS9 TaxID=3079855 RepID=UPI002913A56A|nr:type II secretion system F family protein [Aestuariicoccus sp. MJ-SS9]MDU8913280.1 type II secretion system F family protein [Aestuariicoccus sp. MJ-SS9]